LTGMRSYLYGLFLGLLFCGFVAGVIALLNPPLTRAGVDTVAAVTQSPGQPPEPIDVIESDLSAAAIDSVSDIEAGAENAAGALKSTDSAEFASSGSMDDLPSAEVQDALAVPNALEVAAEQMSE